MEVNTDVFRAISADRDRLRLDVAGLVRALDGAIGAMESSGLRLVPVLATVAGRGRGRHARPRERHLRVVGGGRR